MARSRLDLTPGAEDLPEHLTLEEVRARCERKEATVRRQFPPDGELPTSHEARLKGMAPDTMAGAVKRWLYLTHLSWNLWDRDHGLARRDPGDIDQAARQLLRREPVEVDLGFRTVSVTGRSYNAMVEMARHEARIHELETDLRHCEELVTELDEQMREERSNAARRRIKRLTRIQRRLLEEKRLHHRAILAHAFTDDGAPASSLAEAPDWTDRIGPAEEALILTALFEAGPGRLHRLGPAPGGSSDDSKAEDWGYKSLLATFERRARVDPASYFDHDLGQLIAWMRAGSPPAPEELE